MCEFVTAHGTEMRQSRSVRFEYSNITVALDDLTINVHYI